MLTLNFQYTICIIVRNVQKFRTRLDFIQNMTLTKKGQVTNPVVVEYYRFVDGCLHKVKAKLGQL